MLKKYLVILLLNLFGTSVSSVDQISQASFVGRAFTNIYNNTEQIEVSNFLEQFVIDAKESNLDLDAALNELKSLIEKDITFYRYILFEKHRERYAKNVVYYSAKLSAMAIVSYFVYSKVFMAECKEFDRLFEFYDINKYELHGAVLGMATGASWLLFCAVTAIPDIAAFSENSTKYSEAKSDLIDSLKQRYNNKLNYLIAVKEMI